MKKLKVFLYRFYTRFSGAMLLGTSIAVGIFYVMYLLGFFSGVYDQAVYVTFALVVLHIISVAITIAVKAKEDTKLHKFDQEIVGSSFVGFGKKNKLFAFAQELLFAGKPNSAQQNFMFIEENYSSELDQNEKAVVEFYIGRCYELMGYYPNALRYYQKAQEDGFSHRIIDMLIARSIGGNGDMEDCIRLFGNIVSDKDNPYSAYAYTNIGMLYLQRNDAENALLWYGKAIDEKMNYGGALGGAAIAHLLLHNFQQAEEFYRAAILNGAGSDAGYIKYYNDVKKTVKAERFTGKQNDSDNLQQPDVN